MADQGKPIKPRKSLSLSEKARNYAIGIGALTGLILGAWANLKGEPVAEQSYKITKEQVNAQTEHLQVLKERMAEVEGFVKGHEFGKLQVKIDTLQSENERLHRELMERVSEPIVTKPIVAKPRVLPKLKENECKEGLVWNGKRCIRVHKTVVKKMKEDQVKTDEIRKELKEEKRKRLREENRRKKMEQRVQSNMSMQRSLPVLKKLPDDIADTKGD